MKVIHLQYNIHFLEQGKNKSDNQSGKSLFQKLVKKIDDVKSSATKTPINSVPQNNQPKSLDQEIKSFFNTGNILEQATPSNLQDTQIINYDQNKQSALNTWTQGISSNFFI